MRILTRLGHVILLNILILTSASALANASGQLMTASLQKPPLADINDSQFDQWQKTFSTKRRKLKQLLNDANIDLTKASFLNGLINSHSPYLLRHSVNPVNWEGNYTQGIRLAAEDNKPVFLSIGYSTCHWCHVMEKESFLDPEVATILNRNFISIKLDKEVDVELDRVFSNKQHIIKGESGWPINAILTPDGKMFWTDAYISKAELLATFRRIIALWTQSPERIIAVANNIDKQFTQSPSGETNSWDERLVEQRLIQIANQLDEVNGGLRGNPKFPNAALLSLMLYQYQIQPTTALARKARLFLDSMVNSGLYDHIHGGFFRYAQSNDWQQPHFEKMLYNQALLIPVYAKASTLFNHAEYANITRDIVSFITTWMRASQGGYYSAIDADYQGKEGGYYLFSEAELASVSDESKEKYQWSASGKFASMQPYRSTVLMVDDKAHPLQKLKTSLPPPYIDKKILTSWNALLVTGLLDAYMYTNEAEYKNSGLALLRYLLSQHVQNDTVFRAVIDNMGFGQATLEDYAWLSSALLKAYIITQTPDWLHKANLFYELGIEHLAHDTTDIDWLSDNEFISPLAVLTDVGKQLAKMGKQPNQRWKQQLNSVQQSIIKEPGDYFSAYHLMLKQKHPSFEPTQLFARGNGKASVMRAKHGVVIAIELAPGWHINSNAPLDSNLIATEVTTKSDRPIQVHYPSEIRKSLGFAAEPLSLFEGDFTVSVLTKNINNNDIAGHKLELHVQACNSRLCLLPEMMSFNVK